MLRFSPLQLLLLTFGASLIFLSLILNHVSWMWQRTPDVKVIQWKHLRLVPQQDQQIDALDAETLVVRSSRYPSARLTLFTRPDDGVTPRQMVRNLCRSDGCTYTTFAADGGDLGAAANYRKGEALRIVLIQPGGRQVWLEFKGPPAAFDTFSNLIDSASQQIRAAASIADKP